jgi:hypothetical protein
MGKFHKIFSRKIGIEGTILDNSKANYIKWNVRMQRGLTNIRQGPVALF